MDELDWNDFCVPINEDEIEYIDTILKSISDVEYNRLLENGRKVYEEYFSLEGIFKNIVKRLCNYGYG
jgi:glycosyltransferase involved in cell wall biosynthesis